ncbi:hypothetical protein GUJ93_ZPchr0012g20979 [Zizania palustris]|uniref:Uncharacterized protein n=1 Tax=Zizania palustris TaxID=103762 RepID=A0A8J5WNX7_ZIZPA|nr:hypothetical protein GUJ93_ZPchr0012g20979 [Zizania palustris]
MVFHVKPTRVSPLIRRRKHHKDMLYRLPITKLEPTPSDHHAPKRSQVEEMTEKIEVGINSQEYFTHFDKYGEKKNGIGVHIAKRNVVVMKDSTKKGMCGQPKTVRKERIEDHDLVDIRRRKCLAAGRSPQRDDLQ